MIDLSLIPTADLIAALKPRCENMILVMQQDLGGAKSTSDSSYTIHGNRAACIGLAAELMYWLSSQRFIHNE